MIISKPHKFVFVSNPKCATNAIYQWLEKKFNCNRVGPFHSNRVPGYAKDYYKWTIRRNPYSRAFSLWWSATNTPHNRYKVPPDTKASMYEFMRWVMKLRKPLPVFRSQNEWLSGLKFDFTCSLETLEHDLMQLPFVDDLEGLEVINSIPWKADMWDLEDPGAWVNAVTEEVKELVDQWESQSITN